MRLLGTRMRASACAAVLLAVPTLAARAQGHEIHPPASVAQLGDPVVAVSDWKVRGRHQGPAGGAAVGQRMDRCADLSDARAGHGGPIRRCGAGGQGGGRDAGWQERLEHVWRGADGAREACRGRERVRAGDWRCTRRTA